MDHATFLPRFSSANRRAIPPHNVASLLCAPLGMIGKSVGGGSDVGYQVGCIGSFNLNNIGLDVLVWGRVTGFDTTVAHSWITVDDGSGRESGMGTLGVKVVSPGVWGSGRYLGEMVRVQGSSSLFKVGSDHYPVVRVAAPADISPLVLPD